MRRSIDAPAILLAALFAVILAPSPARTDAAAGEPAVSMVRTLVGDAHQAMAAGERQALEDAISRAFAFDVWERFLVGERELTPAERETFRDLLPAFLANLYAERFGKGLEAAPEVVGAREVRRDVLVKARIPREGAEPLPVEYRVRDMDGRGPQVIDIMVGGISFLLLKRDEFGALIERGGVDALLDFMRGRAS